MAGRLTPSAPTTKTNKRPPSPKIALRWCSCWRIGSELHGDHAGRTELPHARVSAILFASRVPV